MGALGVSYDTYGNAATFTGSVASCGGTVPTVNYAYSGPTSTANYSRLVSMTYPNGQRQVNYLYGTAGSVDNAISRLTGLADNGAGFDLEDLSYLGLNTVVQRAHPQTGVNLTYIGTPGGDGNDLYVGLDRFGRVVDQNWTGSGGSTDHFQYGYDYNSNRLYQVNVITEGMSMPLPFDELYHAGGTVDTYVAGQLQSAGYDVLNQMTAFGRGILDSTRASFMQGTANHTQTWMLDALGNWTRFVSDTSTQNRTVNQQNELTNINTATLGYDNNGNTTTDDYGHQLVYDAWNRLVSVTTGMPPMALASYSYDTLGRRIQRTASSTTTDLYYSNRWQVLEEDQGGAMTQQYVWSPVYVDALVDRDTAMGGVRLYVQQDANWNVTSLVGFDTTSMTWKVMERFVYDPYGKPTDATGQNVGALNADWSTKTGGDTYGWVYLHQGGRYEAITGLYNFRHRDYSPTLGRWVREDPIGFDAGDMNLYRYEFDSPISNADFLGLGQYPIPGREQYERGHAPEPDTGKERKGSWTRDDYERWLNRGNLFPPGSWQKDMLDFGCVGLCAFRQEQNLRGWKPPEDIKGVECYAELANAKKRNCPKGTQLFIFAKQGFGKGGKPEYKDGKPTTPGEKPKPDQSGRVPNDSIIDADGVFNYASLHPNGGMEFWEWMNQGCLNSPRKDQRVRVEPSLPVDPHYPYTIFCTSCK